MMLNIPIEHIYIFLIRCFEICIVQFFFLQTKKKHFMLRPQKRQDQRAGLLVAGQGVPQNLKVEGGG